MTKKTAMIYFSNTGTTELLAQKIRLTFHPDKVIAVQAEKPYPKNYGGAFVRLVQELLTHKAPEIATPVEDLSQYDVVFVGFPIWAGNMPVIMQEYLKGCNLQNVTLIPFSTSGMNHTGQVVARQADLTMNGVQWAHPYSYGKVRKDDYDWWLRLVQQELEQ